MLLEIKCINAITKMYEIKQTCLLSLIVNILKAIINVANDNCKKNKLDKNV